MHMLYKDGTSDVSNGAILIKEKPVDSVKINVFTDNVKTNVVGDKKVVVDKSSIF